MSIPMPLPLPIGAGMLPFVVALGLPVGKASPDDLMAAMVAPMEATAIVAPGLYDVMVWAMLLPDV